MDKSMTLKCKCCNEPLEGKGRWRIFGEILCAACYDFAVYHQGVLKGGKK